MKKIMDSLAVLALVLLSANSGAHTLSEAEMLFLKGKTRQDLVLVKFRDNIPLSLTGNSRPVLEQTDYEVKKVFSGQPRFYAQERARLRLQGKTIPHLENYFFLKFKENLSQTKGVQILADLYSDVRIEYAYFEPLFKDARFTLEDDEEVGPPTPEPTPDFSDLQTYHEPSPLGVDTPYAWNVEGGRGQGVRLIDIESSFIPGHEDLPEPFFLEDEGYSSHHGLAVLGIILAKDNGFGVTGIAPETEFGFIPPDYSKDYETNLAGVIEKAMRQLSPGDIIVIEQHTPGPDDGRMTAIEVFQPIFDAIKIATDQGIHVIAAAGNGFSNLDDENYDGKFDLRVRDSGSIIVGASGHATGTQHLERLSFSNYGTRVDAMGYGENVHTLGYGDLHSGDGKPQKFYTNTFSGTSSATPIVVGAVSSLIGMARAKGIELTPLEVRNALRDTGTRQKGNVQENIGSLPDISELHRHFGHFAEQIAVHSWTWLFHF